MNKDANNQDDLKVTEVLNSPEGQALLNEAMTGNIDIHPSLEQIGEEMIRNIPPLSPRTHLSDEEEANIIKMHTQRREKLNREHPLIFNETLNINAYRSVKFEKRRGLPWKCHEINSAPNGGEGNISFISAISKLDIPTEMLQRIAAVSYEEGIDGTKL